MKKFLMFVIIYLKSGVSSVEIDYEHVSHAGSSMVFPKFLSLWLSLKRSDFATF